jgi:signal peptidase I
MYFQDSNRSFIAAFITYIVALLIVVNFIIMIGKITSGSMEPTQMTGDVEIDNRLAYVVHTPERGDIITFKSREKNSLMGKRVIGIAGDHIEFYDGYVYLNGELFDESAYLDEDVETNCIKTFDVPEGCVFVLGDNREKSTDSRFWENPYISVKDIKGKYMFSIPISKIFN